MCTFLLLFSIYHGKTPYSVADEHGHGLRHPGTYRNLFVMPTTDWNHTIPPLLIQSICPHVCCVVCLVTQPCLTLCDPMDCSLSGSSALGNSPGKNTGVGCHAFLQGSSQPRDGTQVSQITDRFFTIWARLLNKGVAFFGSLSILVSFWQLVSWSSCFSWDALWKVLVTQSCPTLCDPMDYISPGSSVHGILQARILECVAMPFCRGSSPPRDWFLVSGIAGRFFTIWAIRDAPKASESVSCSTLWKSQSYTSKYVLDIFHFICKMNSSYFSLKSSFPPTFLPCMVPNCCRVITWNKVNFCFSFLFFNL